MGRGPGNYEGPKTKRVCVYLEPIGLIVKKRKEVTLDFVVTYGSYDQ